MVNNGKKSKYILQGKNLKVAEQMLKDVTDIFDKHGVRYWLDFGTLLGIVREGRILPWDDDMDISIFEEDRQKVHDVVMPEIKKLNYRTYSRYHHIEDHEVLKKGDFRAFRTRNYRWRFFRGYVKIDIFVMYKKEDYHYWYELYNVHRLPSNLIEEFDTIEFNGKMYTKPKLHDEYLTYHYGDWRTPVKDYDSAVDGTKTAIKE
jgi:phosphorylcholine metabolism protein LicD